jgi:hypothetical protein
MNPKPLSGRQNSMSPSKTSDIHAFFLLPQKRKEESQNFRLGTEQPPITLSDVRQCECEGLGMAPASGARELPVRREA